MPRIGKSEIADRMIQNTPRLVVINSSTSQGRAPVMLRLRPTTIAAVKARAVGPIYLLIEHALAKLVKELDALPAGTLLTLDAQTMDPGPEDHELMEQLPAVKRKRAKDAADAADDDQSSSGRAGAHGKGRTAKD